MELRVKMQGEDIGPRVKQNMDRLGGAVRSAMRESAQAASQEILARGADDIEEAGNFGDDWVDALHADITETQRTITVHAAYEPEGPPVSYWTVFQYGKTIFAHNEKGLLTWPNKSLFSIDGKVPAFISKPSVVIPKKFHLIEIIEQVAQETAAGFQKLLQEHLPNG